MNPTPPARLQSDASLIETRHRIARLWQAVFTLSTLVAIIALVTLLLNILNQSFGYVIVENKVDPASLSDRPLGQLSQSELIDIIEGNLSRNRVRTLERDQGALESLSSVQLLKLIDDNIVKPTVVESFTLLESLLNQSEIEAQMKEENPDGVLTFRSWINVQFIQNAMNPRADLAGVRTALLGSLYLMAITISIAFPIGVGAAIYLEEYANRNSRINRLIQTNIDNLAGVPSIVYGILGLAIFVRTMEPITSGAVFGVTDSNGRTIFSAGLTLALLILPILIINAQEAIRAVPQSLRQASYGLGATQWQTIWNHVLPYALPGILTGTILAISRAIGETAPLIVIGASTLITSDPTGPFSKFTALPIQIYNWTSRPQAEFRNTASAAIVILIVTLLSMNAVAILLRNRFSRRL